MDEVEMTSGVIPLRHSSLPGHIKLPRRYEKAATGSNGIPARVRKISIQPGHSALGDSLGDRLDDLMAAFMWVKQELIMMRQHDILLKRQFFNIQDLIHSLRPKPAATTSTTSASANSTSATSTTTTTKSNNNSASSNNSDKRCCCVHGEKGKVETSQTLESSEDSIKNTSNSADSDSCRSCCRGGSSGEFTMTTFFVRQALSVSVLHEDDSEDDEDERRKRLGLGLELGMGGGVGGDEDREGEDVFTDMFFRHRTSSMRTSRDMAALARRRGSKELI